MLATVRSVDESNQTTSKMDRFQPSPYAKRWAGRVFTVSKPSNPDTISNLATVLP
jgi:hypothetical protein